MIEAIHTAQDEINTNLLEEAAKLIAQASVVSYYPKSRVISTQNVIRDPRPVCQGKDRRAVLSL